MSLINDERCISLVKPQDKKRSYVPPLKLKPHEYYNDLASLNLSQEQADALLDSLWYIMQSMVDIGWGTESQQIAMPDMFREISNSDLPEAGNDNGCKIKSHGS